MPDAVREILADGIEIWHGDCRDILGHVGSVAHVITDPPYEQRSHDATGSIRRSDGTDAPEKLTFDGIDELRDDVVRLTKDICTGWALYFCTAEGVALWRDAIEKHGLKYKTPMVWVKPDAMPKFNGQGPSHGYESIASAWCGDGYSRWNGGGRRGVFIHLVNPPGRDGNHQTEKPLSLMRELVGLFSNPNEIVCDPFMGSGTTGIACVQLGRKFIGIEKEHTYYDLSRRRIAHALRQTDMFVKIPAPLKQIKLPL